MSYLFYTVIAIIVLPAIILIGAFCGPVLVIAAVIEAICGLFVE